MHHDHDDSDLACYYYASIAQGRQRERKALWEAQVWTYIPWRNISWNLLLVDATSQLKALHEPDEPLAAKGTDCNG